MNKKRLQKLEPFFAVSKHRANRIFHKFTFSSWLQQILILGDSSQCDTLCTRDNVIGQSAMKLMKLEMPHGTEPREAFCNQKTVTNILQ